MSRPFRRTTLPSDSPVVPEGGPRVSLDTIIDGPRPGAADATRDKLWRTLRSEFFQWEHGGPFDPRFLLTMKNPVERGSWIVRRRAALAQHFRNDPRVIV